MTMRASSDYGSTVLKGKTNEEIDAELKVIADNPDELPEVQCQARLMRLILPAFKTWFNDELDRDRVDPEDLLAATEAAAISLVCNFSVASCKLGDATGIGKLALPMLLQRAARETYQGIMEEAMKFGAQLEAESATKQ
jgi:hypothetical protein